MKKLICSIFLLLILSLVACRQHPHVLPLLHEAETLMPDHPDSSLILLESVPSPEKLSAEDYATWCLLITQARDKNYVEHTSDSLIDVAVRYFEKRKDPHRKAQAYYCQGRVLSDLNASEEALDAYLKAKEQVEKTMDFDLKARICNHLGSLYWDNRSDRKSLACYKEAYQVYEQIQHMVGAVSALQNIGACMRSLGQLDSAFFYLDKALNIAEQKHLITQLAYLYSSLGNLYEEQGNYRKALTYNQESLKYPRTEDSSSSWYYAIGQLYKKLQMPDSALFYAEKSLVSTNLYVKCSANRLLYDLSVEGHRYEQACQYNESYLSLRESIEHLYQPQKLAKAEALYNKERLVNKQNQQIQKVRDVRNLLLICFLCASLASVCIYMVWERKNRKQKLRLEEFRKRLQETVEQLANNQQKIQGKDILLEDIRRQLNKNEKEAKEYSEKIVSLKNENSVCKAEYQDKLEKKKEENKELRGRLEAALKEKQILVEKESQLLSGRHEQLAAWQKEKGNLENEIGRITGKYNSLQEEFGLLSRELGENKRNAELLSQELEELRGLREEQALRESEIVKGLSLRCEMYEKWRSALIAQNPYLVKFVRKSHHHEFDSKDWEEFFLNFEKVFPEFVDHLDDLYPMEPRWRQICCLVKLGIKNGLISEIYDLKPDTITSIKAEIKKAHFSVFGKQSLDNIMKRWY
ncbi:tetratricopeptide repeat protein [uncultured Parabacteroides sp.]|uniref:tetratricopeptide repeat protein n=1 Tax=uncultured Parabacteroides sp. TaxID=512312 RepID=UPI00272D0B8B|nr:tetratricopeptide repeat protein [uncultured Parabacteroides sp.]